MGCRDTPGHCAAAVTRTSDHFCTAAVTLPGDIFDHDTSVHQLGVVLGSLLDGPFHLHRAAEVCSAGHLDHEVMNFEFSMRVCLNMGHPHSQ